MKKARSRWLAAALIAGVTWAAGPVVAQEEAPIKIAVVDMDRVVAQSKRGQDLQKRLETLENEARADLERLSGEARDLQRQIQTGSATLSQEALSSLRKRYEDAAVAVRRREEDANRAGEKMQTEALERIRQELEPVLVGIREEGGYDLVLNNVPGVVVMVAKRIEITELVLARLHEAEAAAVGGGG